ncbi:hypothetical protein M569_11291, partial [Genlisea aurea]
EALRRLNSTDPPLYLAPSAELSKAARLASEYLYSSLSPYAPKSSLGQLYTEGFDGEQIWQQIDLQARPLLSKLRLHIRNFEKNPEEVSKRFKVEEGNGELENGDSKVEVKAKADVESLTEDLDDEDDDNEEDVEDDEEGEEEDVDDHDEEQIEGKGTEEEENGGPLQGKQNAVEDEFLKINELEEYLLEDEAREFGTKNQKTKRKRHQDIEENEDDDEEEEEEEEDDDDDEGVLRFRYEDFFGGGKTSMKKKSRHAGGSNSMDFDNELNDDNDNQRGEASTKFEKEQEKLRSEIEKMERANLEPKTWTMLGEVTASKRPKNSALEVDLDFEHNVRPAPVITEVNESIEDLIKKRIVEGRFDDVQKRPSLPTKSPSEKIELNETKSKKGLAELYEDEYAQKTGLVSTALSFADEQKKEATMLFKKLCLKLDALSHFFFSPKPV